MASEATEQSDLGQIREEDEEPASGKQAYVCSLNLLTQDCFKLLSSPFVRLGVVKTAWSSMKGRYFSFVKTMNSA